MNVTYKVLGNFRPLLSMEGAVIVSKGYRLYKYNLKDGVLHKISSYNPGIIATILAALPLVWNILRTGFHTLIQLPDGAYVGVVRKKIIYCAPDKQKFTNVFTIPRGSRPLNLCLTPDGYVFFGEYFSNKNRDEVSVYGSKNGKDWKIHYNFKAGSVRHIHGIYWDTYRNGMWVLTGDSDSESGLWFTADNFKTLTLEAGNSQQARAVSVIPTPDGLIVPMDSPLEQNYINFYNYRNKTFECLSGLSGSAFYAVKLSSVHIVSTVAEPSEVNSTNTAGLYASLCGSVWKNIKTYKMKYPAFLNGIFQYPQISIIPLHNNNTVAIYGVSVKNIEGKTIIIRWPN